MREANCFIYQSAHSFRALPETKNAESVRYLRFTFGTYSVFGMKGIVSDLLVLHSNSGRVSKQDPHTGEHRRFVRTVNLLTARVKPWVLQSFVTFDSMNEKCDHSLESC